MQRILITGGNGGLAGRLAAAFTAAGDEVVAPGRSRLDVTSADSVEAFFADAGRFDLLIANAGCCEDRLLARLAPEEWDRQLEANLHGAFRCVRAALPAMTAGRSGHLVFISSQSALHPPVGQAAYAAAKAGLIGLATSLARELGPANIRVNVILPGFIETPMTAGVSQVRRREILAGHTLGRFNTPEAVAGFIVHLHHRLPHTSGQIFRLDSRPG